MKNPFILACFAAAAFGCSASQTEGTTPPADSSGQTVDVPPPSATAPLPTAPSATPPSPSATAPEPTASPEPQNPPAGRLAFTSCTDEQRKAKGCTQRDEAGLRRGRHRDSLHQSALPVVDEADVFQRVYGVHGAQDERVLADLLRRNEQAVGALSSEDGGANMHGTNGRSKRALGAGILSALTGTHGTHARARVLRRRLRRGVELGLRRAL